MDRRAFLRGLVATPAVVAAANIMPVRSIERLFVPILWGDGLHDDTAALQAMLDGLPVRAAGIIRRPDGGRVIVPVGSYWISDTIRPTRPFDMVRSILDAGPNVETVLDLRRLPEAVPGCRIVSCYFKHQGAGPVISA